MTIVIAPPHAYLKSKDVIFNKGVFAGKDFQIGDLIEICPIVEFSFSEQTNGFPKKLQKVLFKWKLLTGSSQVEKYCLLLGFGSLYCASSEHFNLECKSDEEKAVVAFFALRHIKKNEELIMDSRWRVSLISSVDDNANAFEKLSY